MKDFIKKWQLRFDTGLAYISAVLVLLMMALCATDILLRYFLNRPVAGATEATQFMMGGVAFFTFSYVQYLRANISVDVLSDRFSERTNKIIDTFVILPLMLGISIIMAWQGGANAVDAWREWDVTIGLVEFPVGPAKMVVPVGCGLLSLRIMRQLGERVSEVTKSAKKRGGDGSSSHRSL